MPMMSMIIIAAAAVLCLVVICIIIYCRRKKVQSIALRLAEEEDNTMEIDKSNTLDQTPVDVKTK